MEFKKGVKCKPKKDFFPLYKKGDLFVIVRTDFTDEEQLVPIEAMRIKDKRKYFFDKDELEEAK
jgi:hypothetical protein